MQRKINMTHTKGPWVAIGTDPAEGGDWFWINAQPNPAMRGFTKNIGVVNGSQSDPEQEANARRICACVNALEGFDLAAIEGGIVNHMQRCLQWIIDNPNAHRDNILNVAHDGLLSR
jgi:hypothetical protein